MLIEDLKASGLIVFMMTVLISLVSAICYVITSWTFLRYRPRCATQSLLSSNQSQNTKVSRWQKWPWSSTQAFVNKNICPRDRIGGHVFKQDQAWVVQCISCACDDASLGHFIGQFVCNFVHEGTEASAVNKHQTILADITLEHVAKFKISPLWKVLN